MTYMYDIGLSICEENNRFKFNMVFLTYIQFTSNVIAGL